MFKPRPLSPGSVVRIVAPSSPANRERLHAGMQVLEEWGLVPICTERVYDEHMGYLAGDDAERALEFVDALASEQWDGVMAARGGYGVTRILERVWERRERFRPRFFMGFSDITGLHALFQRLGWVSFLGPNCSTLPRLDRETLRRTRKLVFARSLDEVLIWGGLRPLRRGTAKGHILACNLSLLCALAGTRFAFPLEGAILILEDVAEPLYRLDRLLQQLSMLPAFRGVRGLVFGSLDATDGQVDELLREFTSRLDVPSVADFPTGHKDRCDPVPLGVRGYLDADAGVLRITESPFS